MKTYTESNMAMIIITTMIERGIDPDETYTAEAGSDYGYVEAWELPSGDYAIKYGDNGQTDYAIAADTDDLAEWLEYDDLEGVTRAVQTAMVRGIDEVREAGEGDDGPFAVLVSRDYYGPKSITAAACDDRGDTLEFATIADAQEWIDEEEDGPYYLGHNESGRPTYKIIVA